MWQEDRRGGRKRKSDEKRRCKWEREIKRGIPHRPIKVQIRRRAHSKRKGCYESMN